LLSKFVGPLDRNIDNATVKEEGDRGETATQRAEIEDLLDVGEEGILFGRAWGRGSGERGVGGLPLARGTHTRRLCFYRSNVCCPSGSISFSMATQ
jgi:hypothetical protein